MKKTVLQGAAAVLISMCSMIPAQEGEEDKTLSPYFYVQCGDGQKADMPLLSTSADVHIAGAIADVTVSQVYQNNGSTPIEAIYVFPGSTRAAVYALKMVIGERTIEAEVKERQQARIEYEAAKQEGKSAALLEQQRPNVFQMNVANIMPGDTIKVELRYTELLAPVNNIYEFVYPTVVGPRYSNASAAAAPQTDKWISNPYLKQGQKPLYTFDIKVGVNCGMPIQDMVCGTHKVSIQYDNASSANISLDESESAGGNRDFILKYRLADDKIESGVLLYKGDKENFFCMIMQPPKNVTNANIPPREYIFVVDVSGSMNGFPLDISKALLRNLISGLRPADCFNVVLFAGGSTLMSHRSVQATKENIDKAIDVIDNQQGGGGTELLPALKQAIDLPRGDASSRSIIVVTDGYIGFETDAFELIRSNLDRANLFAFGIGSSVNRFLIEGMAHVGGGEPYIVTQPEKGAEVAETFRKYIASPVLTQIKCTYDGFSVYDVEPSSIPDVMASRPIIVHGKWKGAATGTITVSGYTGGKEKYQQSFSIDKNVVSEKNKALKYLWARQKIMLLGDYNKLAPDDARVKEITNLGLTYNLLTEYTSFLAVDKNIRNKTGSVETVKQPLPLPEGVSDLAVGGNYASSPAPATCVQPMEIKKKIVELECKRAKLRSYEAPCTKSVSNRCDYAKVKESEERQVDDALKQIRFVSANNIHLSGKTVLFFWNSTIPSILNEIEVVLRFAMKNPSIKIVLINTEKVNQSEVESVIRQVTDKFSLTPNIYFVHDPQGSMSKYVTNGKVDTSKSQSSFTENGAVKRCLNINVALWRNTAKVFEQFR
jgi:Ca-activated chloride channel family protein